MKIKTIGELKEYIKDLPNDMKVENEADYMYVDIKDGIFNF